MPRNDEDVIALLCAKHREEYLCREAAAHRQTEGCANEGIPMGLPFGEIHECQKRVQERLTEGSSPENDVSMRRDTARTNGRSGRSRLPLISSSVKSETTDRVTTDQTRRADSSRLSDDYVENASSSSGLSIPELDPAYSSDGDPPAFFLCSNINLSAGHPGFCNQCSFSVGFSDS